MDWAGWAVFGLLTVTLFLNMVLHDFGLQEYRASLLPPETWTRIQLANSLLNLLILLAWTVKIWPGRASSETPRPAAGLV